MHKDLGHIIVDGKRYDLFRHSNGHLLYRFNRFELRDAINLPKKVLKAAKKQGHPLICQATAEAFKNERARLEAEAARIRSDICLKQDELPTPSQYAQA